MTGMLASPGSAPEGLVHKSKSAVSMWLKKKMSRCSYQHPLQEIAARFLEFVAFQPHPPGITLNTPWLGVGFATVSHFVFSDKLYVRGRIYVRYTCSVFVVVIMVRRRHER